MCISTVEESIRYVGDVEATAGLIPDRKLQPNQEGARGARSQAETAMAFYAKSKSHLLHLSSKTLNWSIGKLVGRGVGGRQVRISSFCRTWFLNTRVVSQDYLSTCSSKRG